jgi:O-acetyl-ADP-ribose deacetylase (regulator of RNase III)
VLKQVQGDMLLSKAAVLVHGCAPNDPFAQGLALSLREHWPAMYKDFRHHCQTYRPKSGELWAWMGADGRQIVSLFTQPAVEGHHGGKPGPGNLTAVNHALKALQRLAISEKFASLALPRLATGVAGLHWSDVYPAIQQNLGGIGIPVYVYSTFHAGVAAQE